MLAKPDIASVLNVEQDTTERHIKITGYLDDERSGGAIVLRGTIAMDSLKHLLCDDYQREVLASSGKKSSLRQAIENGDLLPDIELGMRGQKHVSKGDVFILQNPVYIIDGLQRVSALIQYLEQQGAATGTEPLGAVVHFDTTKEWEKDRFHVLNTRRIAMSPNVILRNARDKHVSILTLYALSTNETSFALYNRVQWNQRMTKGELISASSLAQVARVLHRKARGKQSSSSGKTSDLGRSPTQALQHMDKLAKNVSLNAFRQNIKMFFELIDVCFGIRTIEHNAVQGHMRRNFLMALAQFLSNNDQLWTDGRYLSVDTRTRKRLRTFPINDPEIRRLCSAGNIVVISMLYDYLLTHMNKSLRTKRFK